MIKNFKEYKKKKKELLDHNKYYYEDSRPKIDDLNYDKLKKQLLDFEKKNQNLTSEKKVSDIVGYEPSKKFSKVKHNEKMLSLDNAFDETDIVDFYKKINND